MSTTGAGAAQRGGRGLAPVGEPQLRSSSRPLPPRLLGATPEAGPVRVCALAALTLFASLQWIRQVAPEPRAAALSWTFLAAGLAAVLIVGRRSVADHRLRIGLYTLTGVGVLVFLLLSCGIDGHLLRPRAWDELVSGIGQGLQALPQLRVPYRGLDEWVRIVVLAGGGLLAAIAAVLACGTAKGSPIGAALALGLLYGIPVVERGNEHPFAGGALFTILLAALLWGDRLNVGQVPLAGALALAAVLVGSLTAPRLDAQEPWIDYQHIADPLSKSSNVRFDWSHHYTPLDWPRNGREALRIKFRDSAYWKGVALERFNGVRWEQEGPGSPAARDTEFAANHPEWRQAVTVVARDISSRELYAPGDVIDVDKLGRPTAFGPGGTAIIPTGERPLRPGDTYRATVYAPKPSIREMQGAGTDYPPGMSFETTIDLPVEVGGPKLLSIGQPTGSRPDPVLTVGLFGQSSAIAVATDGTPYTYTNGREALLRSDYRRVYELAQRLRAGARTPYEVVRRTLRRVRTGASYTEAPPRARLPLVDFLFGSKLGYCQQFSGAMALLLRMNGIPARIAEGFAPGLYDDERQEHVVRDYDAHSWVEVYFPQFGWVAFDPTPSSAPPASQASDSAPSAARGDSADRGGDKPAERSRPVAADDDGGGLSRALQFLLLLVGAGGVAAAIVFYRRPEDDDPDDLRELARALRSTGRAPAAPVTLQGIEAGLAGEADAQGYVQAVRRRRFGVGGPPPSTRQRAALRRALAAGLGPIGRARAWLALPPRAGELRDLKGLRRRSYTG